ncbi:hypothetical protein CR513_57935, partial [Mucuna pruriens]
MDSISNLPLLEIAEEDDSLLFDVSTATTNVFSCSPLLSRRSNPPQTEGRESGAANSENPSSSFNDSVNKENADWNKPQKLSVEPQKMKRKKKGGGVLNPVELSVISGTATPKAGLNLEVIHEEECVGTSIELQEIEENLFMHTSDAVPVKDRKIGLSPKPEALAKASPAPASFVSLYILFTRLIIAKRKVLTVNDAAGNRSKRSACPRLPVASSSYPCHCLPDTVKAPSKELKVTRIPGPKSDVSASTTTARSGMLTTGSSKRNQNAHPATNLQKTAGVKGLSRNPTTVPSNPKVGPAAKCSVTRTLTKRAGKHLDNSVSETHPPSRMHQSGTEANKVSEACLLQGVSDIGEKKHQTQLQTTKLSGLRMPSPSLGFFSLAKAPSSHSQLQKSSKPCKPAKSNIPKLENLETNSVNEARLPHAPGLRSEIVKGATKNCIEELSLLDVKSEPSMQVDNKQMAGVEVEYDSMGSEKISKQEKVENILEHVNIKSKEQVEELHRSENASSMEDVVFPKHEKKLLSESHTQEQLEKEAGRPDVLSNGNQSVFQEPQSMDYHGMQRTSIVKSSISNTVHNGMGQDEDEKIKLLACDVLVTSNESLVLKAKDGISFEDSRLSGEFKEYNGIKTAPLSSSHIDFSETVNGAAADFVTSGGDAQVYLLNRNPSVDCNETTESNLEAANQQLPGEQLKTTRAITVGELSSAKENESHVNSCQLVHMTTLSSKGSPQKSIQEINCPAESEPKMSAIEDCQFPVDDQSGFIQTRPLLEGCEKVIDSKAMHDSTQVFELDRLSEGCTTVCATACNIKVSNVSQESSRPFHEINVENLHFTSQLCPMVKAHYKSSENEMSTNNCCANSELQLRDEGSSRDASMHYEVPCDVPGNFEQQTCKITYSIGKEMLCEDESLVLNHDNLLDQSEFSEVSADFISNTKDSVGSGVEKSSDCLQHTLLAQLVRKVDHTNREIEESPVEDAQVQLFNENPVAYNCNSKHCLVSNDKFPLADNNNTNVHSHLSDFQRPGAVVGVDSENFNNILHLDGDWLPTNIASSEEIKNANLLEGALEGFNIYSSEHTASNHHIQAMPENKDGNLDVDESKELLQMDDSKKGSTDILPSVEVQLIDNVISSECNSFIEVSKNSFTDVVAWKSEEHRSLSENSDLPALDNLTFNTRIPHVCEVSLLNSTNFSDEAETNILEKDEFPITNMQHQSKGSIYFAEDSSKIIHLQKSATESNREGPTVKPPPNPALFCDEWLAAIEAAGELNQNFPHGDWSETVSATACDTMVSNVSQESRPFRENVGNLQFTAQLSPTVKAVFDSRGNDISTSNCCTISELQLRDGSSRDASMHYDVQCDVPGNFEKQTSMITYCKANEMLCEDESLGPNHDHLVDQRGFSEVSADFISNTKDSIGSGAEKPSGHLQHTVLAKLVQEFDHTNREIEESHMEDAQVQSFTEDPVAYNCNSKLLSDIQGPGAVGVDSQNVDNLDGDWQPTNIASKEIKRTNLSEGELEGCNVHTSEHNASDHHIQAMPENKDGNVDADERAELLQMDDAKEVSSDLLPLVEVQLNDNVISSECDSSVEVSKDSFADGVTWKSEEHRSLSESSNLPASANLTFNTRIPRVCCELSSLNSTNFSDEAETNIIEKDEFPNTDMQYPSKGGTDFTEDSSKIIHLQKSVTESNQEVPTVKPPPNAAPFSDEWLAAIEAAGEEILTMKSGAVQNSPPDKPQHEPGPWSPVRRKNQSIGPFDCTKHNIHHSSS